MPEDAGEREGQSVIRGKFEAYSYSSDIFPHPSIIEGYQNAIPDGGKEVIRIVKRQQLFTFLYNMASLLTSNTIPLILTLPIIFAISAGAIVEITLLASIPIGLFTASSAIDKVLTTWRSGGSVEQKQLPDDTSPSGKEQLPSESSDSQK